MKWITEIVLNNYRAFGKPETIIIPYGSHLLIYGENGSGKSSIFNGLRDFFSSSVQEPKTKFNLNKFEEANGNLKGNVILKLSESVNDSNPVVLKFAEPFDQSNHQQPIIILANKFKGFLDYKRMLKIHALDIPESEQPNIFDLLIKELLSEHRVPDPKGGVTTVELLSEYKRLTEILTTTKSRFSNSALKEIQERITAIDEQIEEITDRAPKLGDLSESEIGAKFDLDNEKEEYNDAIKIIEAKELLVKLNTSLFELLKKVFTIANNYLNTYFKNKISIDLNYRPFEYDERENKMIETLSLKIRYAGLEINSYQAFLNEARLSSLAICIYLASIKTFEPDSDSLKVLYLDDVFIGLDTSNRFPLLEIIKKEFIEKGFQVFISTYDRDWFELSQNWFQIKLKGKTKAIELFIDDNNNSNTPDSPVIKQTETNLEKAEVYFKAKDYPAAGNCIRKECEAILKRLLVDTYKCDNEGNPIKELEHLLNRVREQFTDLNIPYPDELINSLKIFRKSFLNPSSHDDKGSPLFKREIEDAMEIAQQLGQIPIPERVLIVEKGLKFNYSNVQNAYNAEIELCDSVFFITYNGSTSYSNYKFKVNYWNWNGVQYAGKDGKEMAMNKRVDFCNQERRLADIFEAINKSTGIEIPVNLESELLIGTTGTLADLLK